MPQDKYNECILYCNERILYIFFLTLPEKIEILIVLYSLKYKKSVHFEII